MWPQGDFVDFDVCECYVEMQFFLKISIRKWWDNQGNAGGVLDFKIEHTTTMTRDDYKDYGRILLNQQQIFAHFDG